MKKLLTLLACFTLLLSCNSFKKDKSNCAVTESQITPRTGHDFEVDGIYYKVLDNTSNAVAVTYKGDSYAAYADEYIGTVTIPSNITYSGVNYAVEQIGTDAFRDCSNMTSIAIPPSVWHIGKSVFEGCEDLKEIHISDLSAWCELRFCDLLDDAGDSPFYYAKGLYLNGKLITDLVVPKNVTEIGTHTFEGYDKLRSVVFHKGVEAVYKSAFFNCSNLTEVTFEGDVEYIGPYAFNGTAWYESKPDGEVYIGKILYKYKGEMPSNASIIIRNGTESICESAFDGCKGLTKIALPKSIKVIHDYAFCGCNNLKEIYCKALTPPYINHFYNDYHDEAKVYVPVGLKDIYIEHDFWSYNNKVEEIDFDN